MIQTVIFDTDGMVVHREMYFSQRFSKEFGVPAEKILPFFENEFQLCLVGKADLKEELENYVGRWGWQKPVDELLKYWFEHENTVDERMLESVTSLRAKGIRCYLDTNNEHYRVRYLVDTLGLKNFFDAVFSSAQLGYMKPQQEFWRSIHELIGGPDKGEVLVWDDDEENVKSAKHFGFQAELHSDFDSYKDRMKVLIT